MTNQLTEIHRTVNQMSRQSQDIRPFFDGSDQCGKWTSACTSCASSTCPSHYHENPGTQVSSRAVLDWFLSKSSKSGQVRPIQYAGKHVNVRCSLMIDHSTLLTSCPTNPKQQAGPAAWPRSSPWISLHGYVCTVYTYIYIYLETMCIHVDLSSQYSMSVHHSLEYFPKLENLEIRLILCRFHW